MTRSEHVELEPVSDSPFDPRLPVIRAGSPEFFALTLNSRGLR